jgi:hypothetical protein
MRALTKSLFKTIKLISKIEFSNIHVFFNLENGFRIVINNNNYLFIIQQNVIQLSTTSI